MNFDFFIFVGFASTKANLKTRDHILKRIKEVKQVFDSVSNVSAQFEV
jgi:hypothetical protein